MFEAEDGAEAGEAVNNPRKLLQKKRSSLAHQPDPGTLDRKESLQQQPEAVYEFQKVDNGQNTYNQSPACMFMCMGRYFGTFLTIFFFVFVAFRIFVKLTRQIGV